MSDSSHFSARIRRHTASLFMVVLGMIMLSYASVPLYRMFCQITGFGGTPMLADGASGSVVDHNITVRFNADTDPSLPWNFAPVEKQVNIKLGENRLIAYTAENTSDTAIHGVATYNVIPHEMGQYFQKIQCFCFEEQVLKPHEKVNMPVSFFIDPAMLKNAETRGIREVTLSYTFFEKKK
jgi:cytochrome c oxidase assembly protein subunit 11